GRSWGAQTFGVSHTPDARCNNCHSTAPEHRYAPHHVAQSSADTPTCAACHLEHQGRAARLTRSPDRYCTSCHAGIQNHYEANVPKQYPSIRDVGSWAGHPPFNLPGSDPGHLKFNHKLHLAPGMARVSDAPLMTWGQVDSAYRHRIGADQADAAAPVQLDCAA